MRILFTASPLRSHLHAMRPLIRAASDAGHEVVVATGPDISANLEQLGVPGWMVGSSPDLVIHDLTDPVGPEVAALLGVPGPAPTADDVLRHLTPALAA